MTITSLQMNSALNSAKYWYTQKGTLEHKAAQISSALDKYVTSGEISSLEAAYLTLFAMGAVNARYSSETLNLGQLFTALNIPRSAQPLAGELYREASIYDHGGGGGFYDGLDESLTKSFIRLAMPETPLSRELMDKLQELARSRIPGETGLTARFMSDAKLECLGGLTLENLFGGSTPASREAGNLVAKIIGQRREDDPLGALTKLCNLHYAIKMIKQHSSQDIERDIAKLLSVCQKGDVHGAVSTPLKCLGNRSLGDVNTSLGPKVHAEIMAELEKVMHDSRVTPQRAAAVLVGVALVVGALVIGPAALAAAGTSGFAAVASSSTAAKITAAGVATVLLPCVKMVVKYISVALASGKTKAAASIATILKAGAAHALTEQAQKKPGRVPGR